MKKITLFSCLIITHFISFSQEKYSLELNPFVRYDQYKEFVDLETVITGKNYIRPSGISVGINANLIKKVNSSTNLYLGVAYYRHSISNIKRHNRIGEGVNRIINFPSPLFIDFLTDKY